jgi:diaminopimelate decarboxylase
LASLAPIEKAAQLDWESCNKAAAVHGNSFYLADVDHFERNCRQLLTSFQSIYPNTHIGYSYKTNYQPDFARRAHAIGAYAEVVSRFELELAEQLGVPGEQIIFNGPIKRADDLVYAFSIGARINVDSIAELQEIARLTRGTALPHSIGVRCFLGGNTPNSRFGIDVASPDGAAALQSIIQHSSMRLSGLHCHHSGNRSPERYRARARAMISLHRTLLRDVPLEYLDIGGGFASSMSAGLAEQLSAQVATFADYADAIAGEFYSAYGDSGPQLVLEPGMAVVADAMVFITRVETVKRLGHRQLAVVDGSIFNIKPLRGSINLPLTLIPRVKSESRMGGLWEVAGNTCMEVDILHTGYEGTISSGDFIAIENVGAYSTVLNAPFIHGTPAVLDFCGDLPGRTLRRASTIADLLSLYAI